MVFAIDGLPFDIFGEVVRLVALFQGVVMSGLLFAGDERALLRLDLDNVFHGLVDGHRVGL